MGPKMNPNETISLCTYINYIVGKPECLVLCGVGPEMG